MDRKYALTAFGYAILGVILGIYMAKTHNHSQLPTHAHIMLLGFVTSFIYAVAYKLWITETSCKKLAAAQFWTHQIGTPGLTIGLFLLYGQFATIETVGPILGIFSLIILTSFILMKVLFIKSKPA